MVNFRIISKIIGSLLFIEAFFMAWCVAMAAYFHEDDLLAFLVSMLVTFGSAFLFLLGGHKANNSLSRHDAFVVVTAVWVVFSIFGMIPFLVHGCISNPTDAYFETTSGFTIAILPSLVGGSVKVFAAEATGPIKAKMHPRLSTTAKWIWSIYLLLTIGCGLSFWLAGMNWFDAINYSMTTTATGGFSIHNDSLAFFRDATIDYIAILFQFLAGINFTLLYTSIFRIRFSSLFRNSEFKFYISIVLLATASITTVLFTQSGYDLEHAVRSGLFQVVSFMTTTGIFSDDVARWPHITWIILGAVMFIGACAGSTSGGFKCIRAVMTLKALRNNFRQILHPNAVLPVKINGQSIPQPRIVALFSFLTLFILMMLVTAAIMILSGTDMINSVVIALSCVSNIGPSLSTDIGANITWSAMPDYVKWILSLLMLMGRLEIMTVLVLFTRSFWKEN